MSVDTWNHGQTDPAPQAQPGGASAPRRPRLALLDLIVLVWRARWMMLFILLPFIVGAAALALQAPTKYVASSRVRVLLGDEYVYDPIVGDAARGAVPQLEEVLQAESELVRSPVIAERVLDRFGVKLLYPDLIAKAGDSIDEVEIARLRALQAMSADFGASAGPKSSVLRMSFAHEDPKIAANVLNAIVDAYLGYRREVLVDQGGGLAQQRQQVEEQLVKANDALQAFLAERKIADFASEKENLGDLSKSVSDELFSVEAGLREAEGRAAALRRQLAATEADIDLYIESNSGQELVNLRLQREQLLSRYRPDSQTIKELDKRIAQMEAFVATGTSDGIRRRGRNPTYQKIEEDAAAAQAEVDALAGRAVALKRQKAEIEARQVDLAGVEPELQRLLRERDALENTARSFAQREQSERARNELSKRSAENITILEAARPPLQGKSQRTLIMLAGVAMGGLTALLAGLAKAWLHRGFPSASSLERTLPIRVIGSAGNRR